MITVPQTFHDKADGQIIAPIAGLYVSFDKALKSGTGWFTLDSSVLDGNDMLTDTNQTPMVLWNLYKYDDYSDRLVEVSYSRSFEFPYNVQSAIADFTLDNHDGYFTPGSGSSIDQYNLPERPLRIYAGFSGEAMIPQFVGITQDMPDVQNGSRTVDYHALDFLTQIADMTLTDIIDMRDARTDEVLEAIVTQFGMQSDQYDFEQGQNVIPFVFFDIGQDAGEAIRKLVQAESGKLWLDENGILRFQARGLHNQTVVKNIPAYSVIDITPTGTSEIINHVIINAEIREVQEYQTVYTKTAAKQSSTSLEWVIPAGSTAMVSCSLEDPCYDVQTPTIGKNSGVSWFTARNAQFAPVTSGITAVGTLTTNNFNVTFTNNNAYDVEIDEMVLWGEPAKVTNMLEIDAKDTDSYGKYGDKYLEITDNQFFQNFDQSEAYARFILHDYAYYNAVLKIEIKGDFSLQLGDVVAVSDDVYGGAYNIDAIEYDLSEGFLSTVLTCHRYVSTSYFTLNQSKLDQGDLLA